MRVLLRLIPFLACFAFAVVTAAAQYGHPLKGSWSGDWGTTKENRNRILLDLHWDGKAVTGTINPGRDGVALKKASLDPANWTVSFEADGKDSAGSTVRYVIEGKLENLGSYYRVIAGTWSQGAQKGDFKITRN
jgi:hypothetical protein